MIPKIQGYPEAVIVYKFTNVGSDGSDDGVIAIQFHDDGDGWPQITVMECLLVDSSRSLFEQNAGIYLPFDVVERIALLVRNRKASKALDKLPVNQEESSLKESFLSDARLAELLDGGYETQDEVHAMALELSMRRKSNPTGGSQ